MKKKILLGILFSFILLFMGVVYAVPPDDNGDGCISLGEISSYVAQWLQGQVTLGEVSAGVSWWLGGCTPVNNTVMTGTLFLGEYRAIDWNPGIPGGIPTYPVSVNVIDYGAVGDGAADDTQAIKDAINAAPSGTAVYLPEGVYRTSSTVYLKKSIVLRGAGIDKTKILCTNPGNDCFSILYGWDARTYMPLVSGYNKGSTQVTVSSISGFQVGKFVEFRQDDDPAVYLNSDGTVSTDRNTGQFDKIIGINGNTLILEKPLYYDFNPAFNAGARHVNTMIEKAGFEDFYLEVPDYYPNVSGGSNFYLIGAANCWVKNVWSHGTYTAHIRIKESYGNEIRDSVFEDTWTRGGGGRGYGTYHEDRSTDNLYINNIFWKLRHAMIVSWGAAGNVFAYNFDADPAAGDYANQSQINYGWLYPDLSVHGHYSIMTLYEGNVAQDYIADSTWGNNGPTTLFRNRILRESDFVYPSSIRKFPHVMVESTSEYENIIANDLGLLGQESVGMSGRWTSSNSGTGSTILWVDLAVNDTAWLAGNYEYLNGQDIGGWNSNVPSNIPSSLFLTEKPSFFGTLPWPAFGPETSRTANGGTGNKIPAQIRYEQLKAQGLIG